MRYLDVCYRPEESPPPPQTVFRYLWKVWADGSYRSDKRSVGFELPSIFLTFHGNGVFQTNETRWELTRGSFFAFPPHRACTYFCPTSETWRFCFFQFTAPSILKHLGLPQEEPVSLDWMDPLMAQSTRMIDSLKRGGPGAGWEADALFRELLIICARNMRGHRETCDGLGRVRQWMNDNLDQPMVVDAMAGMAGMNRTAFYRAFREETGESPKAYFLRLRMDSASLALEHTDRTVRDIAASLGFYDEYHFSKSFKKASGQSPRAWRKGVRG